MGPPLLEELSTVPRVYPPVVEKYLFLRRAMEDNGSGNADPVLPSLCCGESDMI